MSEAQGTASNQAVNPQTTQAQPQNPTGTPGKAPATPASTGQDPIKEAAAEAARKLRVKHDDGNEEEVDEAEVLKVYRERKGHQRVANKELQEGKAAKKQAEQFIQMMKDKGQLLGVLQKLGHDPRKLAEEVLASHLEEELMDPRDKELRDAKARLKQLEDMEKLQKEEKQKRIHDSLKAKYAEDFNQKFVSALKETNLPPSKSNVAEMAKYIHRSAKIGFEMTPQEAAKLVKEDIEGLARNVFSGQELDVDTLVKFLGEQNIQRIRANDVAKIKDPNAVLKTPQNQPDQVTRQRGEAKKRMSSAEWRKFNQGR